MQQKQVITIGKPSIENLTDNESKIFYATLLTKVMEHYRKQCEAIKATQTKQED